DDHSAHQHDSDAVARAGSRPGCEHEGKVPDNGRRRRHQNRTQPRARRLDNRIELAPSAFLKVVGELYNQDSVFGDETDQRNQSDLAINVERGKSEKGKHERTGYRQRYRTHQNDEWIAEALELSSQYQIDQNRRKKKRAQELASLCSQL